MSSNDSENTLRNFVGNVEVYEISLKMFEAALRELDERGIHPKAHTDAITLAIFNLVNCLDEEKQEFSFEELDPDESEDAQDADSFSQSVTNSFLPPTPSDRIATDTDLNSNGVFQTVSATGQGVHTRFLYSKEPTASHVALTSASVPATSSSTKKVDQGKDKSIDADNSDSGYDSACNALSIIKKRAREEDEDEAQAVRNTGKRPNKESALDPGPSRSHTHPRVLRESTFCAPHPDEDVGTQSELVKLISKRSRVLETSSALTLPSITSSAVVSLSAVASSNIVRPSPPATSVASNATAIYSDLASPKPVHPICPSRPRPRGLRRDYAFYIPRTVASSSSSTSPPVLSSSISIPTTSASAPAPIASTSAAASTPVPIHPPSPAASIASNGTTTFSPSALPVAKPTMQPPTSPSPIVSLAPRGASKRTREGGSKHKVQNRRRGAK